MPPPPLLPPQSTTVTSTTAIHPAQQKHHNKHHIFIQIKWFSVVCYECINVVISCLFSHMIRTYVCDVEYNTLVFYVLENRMLKLNVWTDMENVIGKKWYTAHTHSTSTTITSTIATTIIVVVINNTQHTSFRSECWVIGMATTTTAMKTMTHRIVIT